MFFSFVYKTIVLCCRYIMSSSSNSDFEYTVQVVDTRGTALQELTLNELNGLEALVTPAWIYSTKTHDVCWANTEARTSYFGKSGLEKTGARISFDVGTEDSKRASFESVASSTMEESSAAMKIYTRVENDGCVLHVTCPRRLLFKDATEAISTSTTSVAGASNYNGDEIVKLIVRPIRLRQSENGEIRVNSQHLMLFQELSLRTAGMGQHTAFAVNPTDTPLDIIMRMLDVIGTGAQVPAVHARFVKTICAKSELYAGGGIQTRPFESLHQPIALSYIAGSHSNNVLKAVEPAQRSRLQYMFDSLNISTSKNQDAAVHDGRQGSWKRLHGGIRSCFIGNRQNSLEDITEEPVDARVARKRMCKEALRAFGEGPDATSASSIRNLEAVLACEDLSSFDAWACSNNYGGGLLAKLTFIIIESTGLLEALQISSDKMALFLKRIEAGYSMRRPYHNALHAACVVVSVYDILFKKRLAEKIGTTGSVRDSNIILFATIIAAAIHDYQHTGLSNKCIVDLQLPLAIVYNDICPQEQHHSASAFHLMTKREFNFIKHWTKEEQRTFRNYIISLVLHTDMNKHFSILTKLRVQTDAPLSDTMLLLQMVLKAADMSHLTYPPNLHRKWVMALQEEMFCQGDFEKTHGMPPSAMCDRGLPSISETQPDFFEYLALPMFSLFAEKEPQAFRWMLDAVNINLDMWNHVETKQVVL